MMTSEPEAHKAQPHRRRQALGNDFHGRPPLPIGDAHVSVQGVPEPGGVTLQYGTVQPVGARTIRMSSAEAPVPAMAIAGSWVTFVSVKTMSWAGARQHATLVAARLMKYPSMAAFVCRRLFPLRQVEARKLVGPGLEIEFLAQAIELRMGP